MQEQLVLLNFQVLRLEGYRCQVRIVLSLMRDEIDQLEQVLGLELVMGSLG